MTEMLMTLSLKEIERFMEIAVRVGKIKKNEEMSRYLDNKLKFIDNFEKSEVEYEDGGSNISISAKIFFAERNMVVFSIGISRIDTDDYSVRSSFGDYMPQVNVNSLASRRDWTIFDISYAIILISKLVSMNGVSNVFKLTNYQAGHKSYTAKEKEDIAEKVRFDLTLFREELNFDDFEVDYRLNENELCLLQFYRNEKPVYSINAFADNRYNIFKNLTFHIYDIQIPDELRDRIILAMMPLNGKRIISYLRKL